MNMLYACMMAISVVMPVPTQEKKLSVVDEDRIRDLLSSDDMLDEKELVRLGAYTPAAFPLYCRILENPAEDRYIVGRTLYALSRSKGDRSQFVDLVVRRLADKHVSTRSSAVILLAQIGSARDAAPVVALLSDKEWTIPIAAAKTLAAIGDERALVALDVWLLSGSYHDHKVVREHVMKSRDELKERLEREKKQKPPEK